MADYQSIYTGQQIDQGIGVILSGDIETAAENAKQSAQNAKQSETNAKASETAAAASASAAAQSEVNAEESIKHTPKIIGSTWWTWDASVNDYVDSGVKAKGNVEYATFDIDPETGVLTMYYGTDYKAQNFSIDENGYLEVTVNALN